MLMAENVLIRTENLCKYFRVSGGRVLRAVDDVNLFIAAAKRWDWWASPGAESPRWAAR